MTKQDKPKCRVMLDSGAFSAWNRKDTIDIRDYIEYIKDNLHLISCYVSMDVIPGVFGKERTTEQVHKSAKASYRNHQLMKEEGLTPIPVYHQGESYVELEKYLEDGEEYIGISTYKDLPVSRQQDWLDDVFSILTNKKGLPYVKTHGFGITSFSHVTRYPWTSVDSTTWSLTPGYGIILVPPLVSGEFDYTKPPSRIIMSGIEQASPSSHRRQFEFWAQAGKHLKECIEKFLVEEVGATPSEIRYDDGARRRAVLLYFLKFSEVRKFKRFKNRRSMSLRSHKLNVVRDPIPVSNFTIYHATISTSKMFNEILTKAKVWDRLLSYYDLRGCPEEYLDYYVKHGVGMAVPPRNFKISLSSTSYTKRRYLSMIKRVEGM